jgi:hypothetical protein
VPPPQEWTEPDIFRWLLALVTALRGGEKVNPSGDLFAQGFDSLSATFLRNHVLAALRSSRDTKALAAVSHVENSFVYAHPSVERMSSALGALLGTLTNERADRGSAVDKVHALIRRYTEDMPTMNGARTQDRFDERVVLLTGTTGGLGSHLLATLLVDEKVTKVYAMNRPSKASSLERQDASFRDRFVQFLSDRNRWAQLTCRDLDLTLLTSPKLVFIEGDAATEKLGLSTELYNDASRIVLLSPLSNGVFCIAPLVGDDNHSQCLAPGLQPRLILVRAQHSCHSPASGPWPYQRSCVGDSCVVHVFHRRDSRLAERVRAISGGTGG